MLLSGKGVWEKGLNSGIAYFIVVGIPGMFITLSSFKVSFFMVSVWTVTGLINGIFARWVFTKLNR